MGVLVLNLIIYSNKSWCMNSDVKLGPGTPHPGSLWSRLLRVFLKGLKIGSVTYMRMFLKS